MNATQRGLMVLLALLIGPLSLSRASAETITKGEIQFRGAIVEAAQCQPLNSPVHASSPSSLSVQCERSEMTSLVTARMDHDVVVWRSLSPTGKGIALSQNDDSQRAYRVTLSYF
ncbi:hypothetical protein [Pseudomonas sp. Au-Pse12]|uniref:hypothetical protein n=1 Tax=Pseudomonas sp. Au-Pse12 TaxID=2906459 RepID=UPI001E3521E6|nr:hypothetical protein [Pseudomonas sp. Au-Pse12]MCE4052850.1 hypothetical protein [Pseudomonas sp. Au-Pse12]